MVLIQVTDDNLAGRKPPRQLGGMSDVLALATDLGYSRYRPPPSQEDLRNGDDLIRLLRELNVVQRKVSRLHFELQGRKVDMNIAHLTHVSEMEKKIETLARITTILKGVIRNKDRIITRLQQPFPLEFIPVEAEYQKEFSELLRSAANDYGSLTASVSDLHWSTNFREPPSIWKEMLRPIHVALMSCTRYLGAMSIMRESFETLQKFRVGPKNSPTSRYHSQSTSPAGLEHAGSEWSHEDLELRSPIMQRDEYLEGEFENDTYVDDMNGERSSSEGMTS
ncbi:AUGMIN subunit 2-like [Bidens hawaiensis]|uniref:AUGMIN subunit 2-like n=1 Tax=Bidens hawaiensis TaxID=980011 RepID=UPI00404A335C